MKKIILYPNRTFHILLSALAAFYILFHGRSWNILNELRTSIFYITFTVSFVVTFLMTKWVHYFMIVLDKLYGWYDVPVKRISWEVLLGVIGPLLIDFVLLSIYFYFLGSNIFENGFIRHDFPVIVCFVLLLNTCYAVIYFYKVPNRYK